MDDEEANLNAGTKGAEKASLGRTISSHQDLLAAIMDFYARNPDVIGGGDILAITGSPPAARAGIVAASLAGIVIEGDERAIQRSGTGVSGRGGADRGPGDATAPAGASTE